MSKVCVWVAGPRDWEGYDPVKKVVNRLAGHFGIARLILVSGGAPGIDTLAVKAADEVGVHLWELKARWAVYNHRAGPIRNALVADFTAMYPHRMLVAFHYLEFDNPFHHKGTQNAIKQARQRDIPVKLIKVAREIAVPAQTSELAPGNPNRKAAAKLAKARRKRQEGLQRS